MASQQIDHYVEPTAVLMVLGIPLDALAEPADDGAPQLTADGDAWRSQAGLDGSPA